LGSNNEKRKQPAYLRKALEQKKREGRFFPSLFFCETTEEMVAEARQNEKRNETTIRYQRNKERAAYKKVAHFLRME
jgi:hypothetical protein